MAWFIELVKCNHYLTKKKELFGSNIHKVQQHRSHSSITMFTDVVLYVHWSYINKSVSQWAIEGTSANNQNPVEYETILRAIADYLVVQTEPESVMGTWSGFLAPRPVQICHVLCALVTGISILLNKFTIILVYYKFIRTFSFCYCIIRLHSGQISFF